MLNETFAPNEEELDAARRTVAALEGAERDGRGAVELDGRMVDAPIAARARRVIERHAAIQARTARGAPR